MPPSNSDGSDPIDPTRRPSPRQRLEEFADRVEEAAIEAEYATGEREETEAEARAHILVRLARITLGTIVCVAGVIALPLPGPGWLIIAGGLTILSKDVAWADRLLRYVRRRVPGIPEDGKIPRSSMVTMAVVTLAAVSASLWWTFGRGSDDIQAGLYEIESIVDPATSTGDDGEGALDGLGIAIELSAEGPLVVHIDGCSEVAIEVTERTKTSFELGLAATKPCEGNAVANAAVSALQGQTVALGYETDGLVNWFLADNYLTGIENDDGTQIALSAAS